MNADLGVVVLTYGSGGEHLPLLDSLVGEGVEPERILIVHNPSVAGEPAPAPDAIEVIAASHNLGYAAGMNLGIRRQLDRGRELVLALTHDARFRPGALRSLVEAAVANPGYGVLGPVLLLTGTELPFSFGGRTEPSGYLTHRRERGSSQGGLGDCDWVDGGTMLIRAEALRRAGLFDERFWGYVEDADLCLRISRAGFSIAVVVDALADQDSGASKRRGPWAYLTTRNQLAYAQRLAGGRGVAWALWLALYGAGIEATRTAARLARIRPGSPVETWAVVVGTLRGMIDFLRRRWGPPPPGLPGGGDIGNVSRPTGSLSVD